MVVPLRGDVGGQEGVQLHRGVGAGVAVDVFVDRWNVYLEMFRLVCWIDLVGSCVTFWRFRVFLLRRLMQ